MYRGVYLYKFRESHTWAAGARARSFSGGGGAAAFGVNGGGVVAIGKEESECRASWCAVNARLWFDQQENGMRHAHEARAHAFDARLRRRVPRRRLHARHRHQAPSTFEPCHAMHVCILLGVVSSCTLVYSINNVYKYNNEFSFLVHSAQKRQREIEKEIERENNNTKTLYTPPRRVVTKAASGSSSQQQHHEGGME